MTLKEKLLDVIENYEDDGWYPNICKNNAFDLVKELLTKLNEEEFYTCSIHCFAPSWDDPYYYGDGSYIGMKKDHERIVLEFSE